MGSPLEEIEDIAGECLREYDYVWIDTNEYDLTDPTDADRAMPYDGAHLYPRSATELLLETEVIGTRHITGGRKAAMGVPPQRFREAAVACQNCVEESSWGTLSSCASCNRIQKIRTR